MLPNRDLTKHPACNWIPTGAKATCVYGIYSACLILEYLLSSTSLSYLSPSCCSSQVWCEGNWLPPPSPKALEELSFSASPLQSLQREALPNKATGGCIIQQRDSLWYEKKAAARGGAFFFFSSGIVGFARTGLFRAPGPWVFAPCGGGGAPPLFSQKLSAACECRPCRVLLSARRHGVVLLPPQPPQTPLPPPPWHCASLAKMEGQSSALALSISLDEMRARQHSVALHRLPPP